MPVHSRNIYLSYFRLGDDAWREKVRYYEENKKAIDGLYFDEKIELDIDYLICLFEVGRYERFLRFVDPIIESVITENIYTFKGDNIFNDLLFKKAACLYQQYDYKKTKEILLQLIAMDPDNNLYIGLYSICNRKLNNDLYLTLKATAMSALLIVCGITLARILLEPIFEIYFQPFLYLRGGLILYAIGVLFGLEIAFQLKLKRETGMFSFDLLNQIFGRKIK
ncbi:MAG: hypothetical protein IPJ13_06920 [Saprospiraceae bacterium]|jgi:tetratricopeptide (TPR) repeat protein|nr:hypothetical protein [Saprospiraceae bacterium]